MSAAVAINRQHCPVQKLMFWAVVMSVKVAAPAASSVRQNLAGGAPLLIKFCRAINPPNVVLVSAQAAIWMAAPGAAALAHSASRMASASFGAKTPGALQLLVPLAGTGCTDENEAPEYEDRPSTDRNVFQSFAVKTSVSSIRVMD